MESRRRDQRQQQLAEAEARLLKDREQLVKLGLIGIRLVPSRGVAEYLLHHAPLARGVVGKDGAELSDRGKLRIRNTLDMRRGVERQFELLCIPRLIRHRVALQLDSDGQLLAVASQVVELFEAQ